jgi:hypothetical protein
MALWGMAPCSSETDRQQRGGCIRKQYVVKMLDTFELHSGTTNFSQVLPLEPQI